MDKTVFALNGKIDSLTNIKLTIILSNFQSLYYYLKIYKKEIDIINLKKEFFANLEVKESSSYLLVKISKEKLIKYLYVFNFSYIEIYDDFVSFSKLYFGDFDGCLDVKNNNPNLFIFIDREEGEFGVIFRESI